MADEIVYTINLDTDQLNESLTETSKNIEYLKNETKDLTKQNKELEKAGLEGGKAWSENNKKITQNKEQLKDLNGEYRETSKTIKTNNKLKSEETGHLQKLKAELSLTTAQINKLTKAELADVNVGGAMIKKQKTLADELKNTEEAGGNYTRSVGDYAKGTEGLGNAMGMAGGKVGMFGNMLGKLPNVFSMASKSAKAFGTALMANPLFLVLGIIGALIAVITAAFSKFQPLIDWISDKLAFLGGLVDGFMESMKGVGDIIMAVFSGDFEKAIGMVDDMGDAMYNAAQMAELYNKSLREVERQQKLNDATTSEATATMKKLENEYRDMSKSAEERAAALMKLSEMKLEQAKDDYKQTAKLTILELMSINKLHGTKIKNSTDAAAALEAGKITEEEYLELLDKIIKSEEDRAKVIEVTANAEREAGRIKIAGLRESLTLIKAQTKYYEAKNQSILEGEKVFTEEMLEEEEARLTKIANKQKWAAKKEYEAAQLTYKEGSKLLIAARLKYSTEIININKATNDKILSNNKEFAKQQLTTLQEQYALLKQQNIEELKDVTIETENELETRLNLHKANTDREIEILLEKAEQEKWSKAAIAKEKLIIEQKYTTKEKELKKSLSDYQDGLNVEDLKKKEDAKTLLLDIEKNYNDQVITEISDRYKLDLELLNKNYKDKNSALKLSLENEAITKEEFDIAKKQLDETQKTEQLELEKDYNNKKVDQAIDAINKVQDVTKAIMDINNIQRDIELTKIKNKYDKENEYANNSYKNNKDLLDKKLKDGLISQSQYDNGLINLKEKFDATQKTRDDERIAAENKAKKEAFEKNKKFQMANIVMDAAAAVIATWAAFAEMPIYAAAQTVAIGAMAGFQLSKVNEQEFSAAGGGILKGPLHAAGGINMGNVEAEGDEFIINRASTQAYTPLLNSINQAGNTNGDINNVSPLIDYELLASVLQSKKVYVVSHEISNQQEEDIKVEDRTSF